MSDSKPVGFLECICSDLMHVMRVSVLDLSEDLGVTTNADLLFLNFEFLLGPRNFWRRLANVWHYLRGEMVAVGDVELSAEQVRVLQAIIDRYWKMLGDNVKKDH